MFKQLWRLKFFQACWNSFIILWSRVQSSSQIHISLWQLLIFTLPNLSRLHTNILTWNKRPASCCVLIVGECLLVDTMPAVFHARFNNAKQVLCPSGFGQICQTHTNLMDDWMKAKFQTNSYVWEICNAVPIFGMCHQSNRNVKVSSGKGFIKGYDYGG